jgi:hypothetical protein
MKNIFSIGLLMSSVLTSSLAHADAPQVVSGNCQLQDSGEVIVLKNLDPFKHFGMFAEGHSQEGFRVYLTMNVRNSVDLNIQTPNNSGFTAVELAKSGPTRVHTGISVRRASGNDFEWLSCKLEVQ